MEKKLLVLFGSCFVVGLLWRKRAIFQSDLTSFPRSTKPSQMVYNSTHVEPCHKSANALFLLLTGYDTNIVDFFSSSGSNHIMIDKDIPEGEGVYYYIYVWDDEGKSGPTSNTHHIVYHKGFLYQSYRTDRYTWISFPDDGYPLLRTPIHDKEMREIFSQKPSTLTVEQFNQWCAPSNHPLPIDAPLRLVRSYSSSLNTERMHVAFSLV